MSKYNTFLVCFIVSVAAFVFLMILYIQGIFALVADQEYVLRDSHNQNPLAVFSTIFTPGVIISGLILVLSSLATRVLGIVYVAKNKIVTDGEKAIWIVGFVLMGFVTAIVFLIMARGRKFVD